MRVSSAKCGLLDIYGKPTRWVSTSAALQKANCGNRKTTVRGSRPEVFCRKVVLRNFTKFTGKHLCQCLFLKETLAHVCSCEFCEISKKTFFHRTPLVSASGLSDQEQYTRIECVGLAGLSTDLHGDQLENHIVGVFQTTCMEVNKFSRNPPTEKQESCNSETSEPARRHERKEEVAEFGRR